MFVLSSRGEVVGHRGDFSLYRSLVLRDGSLLLSETYLHLVNQQTQTDQQPPVFEGTVASCNTSLRLPLYVNTGMYDVQYFYGIFAANCDDDLPCQDADSEDPLELSDAQSILEFHF